MTALVKNRETGEHSRVRADYLVAADGPRSPVREQLRIGQSGPGDLFHNVSITFRSRGLAEVVGDRRFIVCYLTKPGADGALLPVDNEEKWVFHAPWHPDQGETLEEFTDQRCADHIRRAIGASDLDVEITGKAQWHAAERVARHYAVGRVFLVGDSAHEMSPTGAFGSNTGIQDAHNLAWKLAAVLEGAAHPRLLLTYEAERLPVARATSERASARSAEHSHPGYAPAPGAAGAAGGRQGGVLSVAMGYRYTAGAVVGGDAEQPVVPEQMRLTGDPGSRAPTCGCAGQASGSPPWTSTSGRSSCSAPRAPGGAAPRGGPPRAWTCGWRRTRSAPARTRACSPRRTGGDWAEVHGTTPEGAILVRPDGFVAWRSPKGEADPEPVLYEVLSALLGRTGD
ncbi:hypothetical protein GCM10020254_18200 [Streptomyces goshikiensis]